MNDGCGTIGAPLRAPDILKFCEIWRPTGMGGSPAFWRELNPVQVPGYSGWRMNERGERVPMQVADRTRFNAGPWRLMNPDFSRKVAALPNSYFTLDDFPGITFCVRRFRDKYATDADKAAIRVLWVCGNPPAEG